MDAALRADVLKRLAPLYAAMDAAYEAAASYVMLSQVEEYVRLLTQARETVAAHVALARAYEEEGMGSLGCLKCVKRTSCVYSAYDKRSFDPKAIVDKTDTLCVGCMQCVQDCKKNILSRGKNPRYEKMGNAYWTPSIISDIWKQAENGKIPVSGAGYRGPFSGPGIDQMWTDMSEIVRPTRDGIHGREYISTVIELGRKPSRLVFDARGGMVTEPPPFIELPVPLVLEVPGFRPHVGPNDRSHCPRRPSRRDDAYRRCQDRKERPATSKGPVDGGL